MNFQKLKEARRKKGLTQEQLAKKIGVNRSVISKYESGMIEPSVTQIEKIADALEVNPFTLIGVFDGISALLDLANNPDNEMIGASVQVLSELCKTENIKYNDIKSDNIPIEFNNFSVFISDIGYSITREESKYYLVNGNEKKEITHEELKTLVKTSKTVLKGILESFMNEDS